jgi:hypothetical protein
MPQHNVLFSYNYSLCFDAYKTKQDQIIYIEHHELNIPTFAGLLPPVGWGHVLYKHF